MADILPTSVPDIDDVRARWGSFAWTDANANFAEPIVVKSVPDEIQHKILSLLSERKLLPGDRLPAERELAGALRVSRTTLRDASRAAKYANGNARIASVIVTSAAIPIVRKAIVR